jgi:nuclear transport factor 2 (NTF2) superfamily protein
MNEVEQIELARAYVALSNAHKLDFVLPMFAVDAVYYSAFTGEFEGQDAITEMMTKFFTKFPDVRWMVEEFWYIGEQTVGFEFVMTATEQSTGSRFERQGVEKIEFTDAGLIRRLEVNRK